MLGAIAGDVIGSVYEGRPIKTKKFDLFQDKSTFTDDSVLTVAVASALMTGESVASTLRTWYFRYPDAGFGKRFIAWAKDPKSGETNSFGNGAAMRVSPVGWFYDSIDEVLHAARETACVTHSHPDGIKGAQAVALAVFAARKGYSRQKIQAILTSRFGYDLNTPLERIRPQYRYDLSSNGSVPQAIRSFLESKNFEDAIRNAVSLGGDSDTQAAIAGAIAEAYYHAVPENIERETMRRLPQELRDIIIVFRDSHQCSLNTLRGKWMLLLYRALG